MKKSALLSLSLSAWLLTTPLTAATLGIGDIIGIDAGPTSTANWMNWNPGAVTSTTFTDGNVVNLDGDTMDGIALTITRPNGSNLFSNNDGPDSWAGLSTEGGSAPSVFVDSVTTDIAGSAGAGGAGTITLAFSGLDPAYTYRVVVVTSTFQSTNLGVDDVTVVGSATSATSSLVRGTDGGDGSFAGNFHHFTGITSTGSGGLDINVANNNNPLLTGAILEVIPEPGSFGAIAGVLALSLCLVRRRARRD